MVDVTSTGSTNNEVQHNHSHSTGHRKGSGQMFSGLKEYKRDSENAAHTQRRESLKEMSAKPQPGVLSNLWNNTFREPEKK